MLLGFSQADFRAVVAAVCVILVGACSREQGPQASLASATPPSEASSPAKVSVRFPIPIRESGQSTFYLAQDRGHYAREGLDVRFEMGSPQLNPVKLVATGEDTFGVLGGPDTLLVARSKGQPLKAVAILHRNSNFSCLVTLAKSGITRPEQLRGKKIGFYYGHISTDVLRSLLHRQKIAYQEVDVGFDYNQLISGAIAAEWAFTVTAALDLPARGVELNVISPADYGIVTHGYTIFASEETIQKQPEVVLKFLRATLKGVTDALASPEAANEALLKRDSKLDPALNLKRQQAYNAVTSHGEEFPPGYMDREMFQSTYDRLVEEKVIEKAFAVEEAYTTQFLNELYGKQFR